MTSTGLSTAGAIPVRTDKGETMVKVKVQRYVSGRVPKYAEGATSSEDEDDFIMSNSIRPKIKQEPDERPVDLLETHDDYNDRRLRRLMKREHVPSSGPRDRHRAVGDDDRENEDDSDADAEENLERRHSLLIERRRQEEELLASEKEDSSSTSEEEDEEESEYEDEYSESEDETGPRLKPVFIPKKDRITFHEKKMEELRIREAEVAQKKAEEERRKEALRIIQEENKREILEKERKEEEAFTTALLTVATDDEDEEEAYEKWKLRELKRIKRDKEEAEKFAKEQAEIQRIRNMTEEERKEEFEKNPKVRTNAAPKGKYRFLQKYYHRGAFFLDKEDEVYKQDFAQPTGEDTFDKTILPKIMQKKNFGRSGQTKYTHLVDQDTTAFDSPWSAENAQTTKFVQQRSGGFKQIFERPTKRRK